MKLKHQKIPSGYIRKNRYYILDETNLLRATLYRVHFASEKEAKKYIEKAVPHLKDYSFIKGSAAIESNLKLKPRRNTNGYIFPLKKTVYPRENMTKKQKKRYRMRLKHRKKKLNKSG